MCFFLLLYNWVFINNVNSNPATYMYSNISTTASLKSFMPTYYSNFSNITIANTTSMSQNKMTTNDKIVLATGVILSAIAVIVLVTYSSYGYVKKFLNKTNTIKTEYAKIT